MLEAIIGIVGAAYAIIGVAYSIKMESNKALKQSYRTGSDHDWAEICFAVGFAWPFAPLIHYVMRRKNASA